MREFSDLSNCSEGMCILILHSREFNYPKAAVFVVVCPLTALIDAHIMHQSIPPAPSLPPPGMANSRGWGLLSCQIPQGGDEKRGQMPRPLSTLQHFSLIAQSSSAILNILTFDFFFQLLTSSLIVIYSAIPNKTSCSDHTSLWF